MNKLLWLVTVAPLLVGCAQRPTDWGRRECPKEWYWQSLWVGVDSLPFQLVRQDGMLTGPGPIQNVPEFHDCQKFMVDDGSRSLVYSDYFAIFAVFDSSFSSRQRKEGVLSRTAALALLDSLPADSERRPQLEDSLGFAADAALPAAEIVAWADYDDLGIKAGFNCLYLFRRNSNWQAEMVPSFDKEQDCSEPNPNPGSGTQLGVQETDIEGFRDADYPPVARWDWDETNRLQYIGIKCGASWCEVHAPQQSLRGGVFASSLTLNERADIYSRTAPAKQRRTTTVKGWYDEQFLAVPSSMPNQAVPSEIRGVVVPHPELGDRNSTGSYADDWVLAAEVALWVPEGVDNPYYDKFYLSDTPKPSERMNQIYLCSFESGGTCAGAEAIGNCNDGVEEWRARIIRAEDGDSLFTCVKRCDMDNEDFTIFGTARWRWLPDDEGLWMRCRNGCCEVSYH